MTGPCITGRFRPSFCILRLNWMSVRPIIHTEQAHLFDLGLLPDLRPRLRLLTSGRRRRAALRRLPQAFHALTAFAGNAPAEMRQISVTGAFLGRTAKLAADELPALREHPCRAVFVFDIRHHVRFAWHALSPLSAYENDNCVAFPAVCCILLHQYTPIQISRRVIKEQIIRSAPYVTAAPIIISRPITAALRVHPLNVAGACFIRITP